MLNVTKTLLCIMDTMLLLKLSAVFIPSFSILFIANNDMDMETCPKN